MLFAIGDIHGCADELRLLLNKLPRTVDTTLVFLGDYVDRGSQSRQVIDTILEVGQQCEVIALKGNHEAMFLDYLRDPTSARAGAFIYNGGSATLASYADEAGEITIPDSHHTFLANLRVVYQTEHNVFVHAGLPNIPLAGIDEREHAATMLWVRGRFLTSDYDWGKVVVHGHTPVEHVTFRPNRINIDTGCVFDRRLTALALPGEQRFSVRRLQGARHTVLKDPSGRRDAFRFKGSVPVRIKRGADQLEYVTLDYSELGMYMRAVGPGEGIKLDDGERIEGTIGPDERSQVAFVGFIVRRRYSADGAFYGVKIVPP